MLPCFFLFSVSNNSVFSDETNSTQYTNSEMLYWQSVKDSENIEMYRAYIRKYPSGIFIDLATIKVEELKNKAAKEKPEAESAPPDKVGTKHLVHPPKVQLRSNPCKLEQKDLERMLKKYNFCDLKLNKYGEFQNELVDNKDGTITDESTGLTWERAGSWRMINYENAKDYLDDLNGRKFAGRSNWRLPTVEELASLIESRYSEKNWLYIDPLFGDPAGDWIERCWSADGWQPRYGYYHTTAWVVSFRHGMIMDAQWTDGNYDMYRVREFNYVRAVSSPE